MTWDTLLIDGTDTATLFTVVEDWSGMESGAGVRGSNYSVPGRGGEVWRRKPRDVGQVSIGIAVLPADPVTGVYPSTRDGRIAQLNANWQTIKRLVGTRRRPLSLSRRLSLADGEQVTLTASAEFTGDLGQSRINAETARAVLTFRLLDGCWFSEEPLTYTVNAGVSTYVPAVGTTDTANMTVTLSGISTSAVTTLTNVSAGVSLTYDLTGLTADNVLIDVDRFTVTRNLSGVANNSLSRLTHVGDDRFMVIDPDLGDNEFTISSGSAVISYRGAWL